MDKQMRPRDESTTQLISTNAISANAHTFSVSGIANGIYLVRIKSGTDQFVKKLSIVR